MLTLNDNQIRIVNKAQYEVELSDLLKEMLPCKEFEQMTLNEAKPIFALMNKWMDDDSKLLESDDLEEITQKIVHIFITNQ